MGETNANLEGTTGKLLETISQVRREMAGMTSETESIQKTNAKITESTARIVSHANEIQGFARDIQKISSKTNMLALNASIEAARSGEVGKGFAVVAEEMRNLANDTKISSEKILDLLSQFMDDLESMETDMKNQEEAHEQQAQLTEKLVAQVEKIEESTKEILLKEE
ncbi:MAG: hypothetical protein K5739_03460 [Lachnospiraceae bacterium]|nr:hypothetical protein [Lachnospiraceae bacterium]